MRPLQENYDYITICKTGRNKRQISSKSDFINGNVIIKTFDDRIIFRKAGIDYNGKTFAVNINKKTKYSQIVIAKDLPTGKFYFDFEDSSEDEKIIYFDL